MVNLNDYINKLKGEYKITEENFIVDFSKFLVSNNWFGFTPIIDNDNLLIDDTFVSTYGDKIKTFCSLYSAPVIEKNTFLHKKIDTLYPETDNLIKKFVKAVDLDENSEYHLTDFILSFLAGEIDESTDTEILDLMNTAYDELPKLYSDILCEFINWVKENTKTIYQGTYTVNSYSTLGEKGNAYSEDAYLEILYCLFNQDYVTENGMIEKAVESKNYIDTWLFIALHFVCALRNTDIVRLPHPKLTDTPENVLKKIKEGTFEEADAKLTLYSITWYLESVKMVPNKTKRIQNVPDIKLHIPVSTETFMGTLFAIAESHFQLTETDTSKPYIRVITQYEQINRYMGEEIGDLFLDSNFRTRSANKSYMQMIYLLTDDILELKEEFNVKGYVLAALARSHKGSYGDFAKTTSIYLNDAKMNGYTPEFVAREMFERGVLSMIPSMLLKMIVGEDFEKMSVKSQTKLIKELNLTPLEIEKSVELMQTNMNKSVSLVKNIYQNVSKEDIINALHRIGNGEAVAKNNSCLCLLTAMGKICPYDDNQNCPHCDYEISTKTTMMLMARECKRLQSSFLTSNMPVEKERYKAMAKNIVIPAINEMMTYIQEFYGDEMAKSYEKILAGEI